MKADLSQKTVPLHTSTTLHNYSRLQDIKERTGQSLNKQFNIAINAYLAKQPAQ